MTELKVNLQGSWKRLLAMITVVAMCCTVIYVSPVSAATAGAGVDVNVVTAEEMPANVSTVEVSGATLGVSGASATISPAKAEIAIGGTAQVTFNGTVTVTATEGDVTIGDIENVEAAFTKALAWEVVTQHDADKKVVTKTDAIVAVDQSGKITGKALGTAQIQAKVSETELAKPVEITVVPEIKSVSLSQTKVDLNVNDITKLEANINANPTSAEAYTTEWNTSNEKIAVVSNGEVTAKAEGTAKITAVVKAKFGSAVVTSDECTVTVKAAVTKDQAGSTTDKNKTTTPAPKDPAKGAVVTVKSTKYKVTNTKKKEVAYQAPKNKKVKKVTVPATVKINGKSYKVTSISNGAFKNCKKLTNVTVGKNVKKIGKAAFQNCKKTKKIVVKTKNLKSVGAKAFKGVPAKAKVDVPNKKKIVNKYKKMFQKAGLNKKCKVK